MEVKLSAQRLAKFPDLVLPEPNPDDTEIIDNFRERIRTYINDRVWGLQQAWLYPTICAQYGWKCITNQDTIANQLLQCETCRSTISPAVLNGNNFELYQKCLQNTLEKLKTSHKKHCPWPLTPCPDHYVKMYPMHKEEAYLTFVKRLKSLYALKENLPCIEEDILKKVGLSVEVCSSLCKISFHMENDFSQSAILLAVTGWSPDPKAKTKLQCLNCQRSVALLLYTSIASTKQKSLNTVTPKAEAIIESRVSESSANGSHSVKSKGTCDIPAAATDPESVQQKEYNNSNIVQGRSNVEEGKNTASKNEGSGNEIQSPPAKKKKHTIVTEYFDPLYEHRSWCPWLVDSGCLPSSNKSQSTLATNIPGWKLFINCLLRNTKHVENYSSVQNSPLRDQIKHARHMLKSWNSPE